MRVGEGIPPLPEQRQALRRAAADLVGRERLTPPIGLDGLKLGAARCIEAAGLDEAYLKYATVILSNETWREAVAAVPYERRLLLLPQCLRDPSTCPAQVDEYGLTCTRCGGCLTGNFLREAEQLGYTTLVAEGSALVMSLIEGGGIDAVVGVSCLEALEEVFPYMELAAMPGIAIPLLCDGCRQTTVQTEDLWDALYLGRDAQAGRLDLDSLRAEVDAWFAPERLEELLEVGEDPTGRLAVGWLAAGGKRWRPLLLASAMASLGATSDGPDGGAVRRLAVAVECFHKASLIHDDIEDHDPVRYGRETLHEAHGMEIALNIGDLLLGEGYRLIARCGLGPDRVAALLAVAAEGHRSLCMGQGLELRWMRQPAELSLEQVLQIDRLKTAPAFEVALRMGSVAAGGSSEHADVLRRYSEALGVAYQVRDDLADFLDLTGRDDLEAERPSVLLALASAKAAGRCRELLAAVWARRPLSTAEARELADGLARLDVRADAAALIDRYKADAQAALAGLAEANLKVLLHRLIGRIFWDVRNLLCCRDVRG